MELPVRLTLEQIAQYDAATELWQASLRPSRACQLFVSKKTHVHWNKKTLAFPEQRMCQKRWLCAQAFNGCKLDIGSYLGT